CAGDVCRERRRPNVTLESDGGIPRGRALAFGSFAQGRIEQHARYEPDGKRERAVSTIDAGENQWSGRPGMLPKQRWQLVSKLRGESTELWPGVLAQRPREQPGQIRWAVREAEGGPQHDRPRGRQIQNAARNRLRPPVRRHGG